MYVEPNKVILTDADGVLLDWEYAFACWMDRHGYVIEKPGEYKMDIKYGIPRSESSRLCRMFNESATIRRIPPLRDAIHYVRKLHQEHGYVFHVISSLSDDEYAQHLRTKNLTELFGPSVFERYTYLGCGADKHEALELYRDSGCWWIEDKPENADLGLEYGLESMIMRHKHNDGYQGKAIEVVNWKEVYQRIVG